METAVTTHDLPMELSVADLLAQVRKIQEVMKQCMKENEHYGVIPGTNKPTLLKPGAEKLNLVFRFDPQYDSVEHFDGDHLTIKSKCTLYHIPTQLRIGSGEGSCSTKETKYAYRAASLACPDCAKDAIIKGKAEYGGGWLCFKKKGGCGAKFPDNQFESAGKVPNDALADQYNTVLKMANKRSLIAAVLNATAASDIFTQDLEDMADNGQQFHQPSQPKADHKPPARATQPASTANVNWITKLGQAILDSVNSDKKAAKEILKDIAEVDTLSKLDQTTAMAAYIAFEKKYLSAGTNGEDGRTPGEEG
jgi:hypothetical protein